MYTKEEIENFFHTHNVELLSIESEPRKNKYNREVQIVVRCCIDGCQETVTKSFRNHTISKNFGCKDHSMGLKSQKYKETQRLNRIEKTVESKEQQNDETVVVHETNESVDNKDEQQQNDETVIENKDTMILDETEFNEDLITQFFKNHYFFEYNGHTWTKANDVARFLDFKEVRNTIYHHVPKHNKMTFNKFPDNVQKTIIDTMYDKITHYQKSIHSETMFINNNGVYELFIKSNKPIAKSFRNHSLWENFRFKKHCMKFEIQEYKETNEETEGDQDNMSLVILEDMEIVKNNDTMITDTVELTEDFKTQFLNNHYFFEYDRQVWTKAKDVAHFLDFNDTRRVICHHVSESNKIMIKHFPDTIQKIIRRRLTPPSPKSITSTNQPETIHPETMFINDEGVFDLFMKSRKPIAKAMKRWLVYEVIPSIIKTGIYSIVSIPIAQSTIQSVAVADPRSTKCHNPNGFSISSMKSAIYILQLPLLNMYKFGYSNNLINRFKQHEYDFGEISIELIIEAPDIQEIEKRLKNEIRSHGINTVYEIDGRKLKELFVPEHFDKVSEIAREIVNNYNTDSFTNIQNHEYRMSCELSKQKQKDVEMKQKDIEMTVELCKQKQYDIEILKLTIELEITRKRKLETL